LRFRKLNESTAIDDKNIGWFRHKAGERHALWVKCQVCGHTVQYYWSEWPNKEYIVCDACFNRKVEE